MAGEDPEYNGWLHDQACACAPCANRDITTSHPRNVRELAGGKRLGGKPGKGQRAPDRRAYPACGKHHTQAQKYEFDNPRSYFYGWTKEELAAWERRQGEEHYGRFLQERQQQADGELPADKLKKALRRQGFDPIEFGARWCKAHELGDQLGLELGRDLRREMKEGGVPL